MQVILNINCLNINKLMTKKQTATILKVQSSDFLKKKKTWKYKDALIVTMLTLGGIYAVFFTLILIENSDAVINLFQAQALLGGLFVNLCAVISVAYSKFAKEILVHRNVYWLSLASFVIIIAIFAQARVMCDTQMSFIFSWLENPLVSVILQTLLGILIFAIAAQKELNIRVSYNKKKLS